jgi:hypothetical protein
MSRATPTVPCLGAAATLALFGPRAGSAADEREG